MKASMMIPWAAVLAFGLRGSFLRAQDRELLSVERSEVTFLSVAPLERISAVDGQCTGLIDPMARTFAVQVPIIDFQGFNSPLQKEHFNENYMEAHSWPNASFSGRIIETIDLKVPGTYMVRAKGTLKIHGVGQERIIPCKVVVTHAGVRITTDFEVALADHDIRIPRVVEQKIAPVIQVKVDLLFKEEDRT